MAQTPNVFEEYQITLAIPAQHFTSAHKSAIQKSVRAQGTVALQQHCAVAEATNEALGGVYNDAREIAERQILDFGNLGQFVLNNSARARFGIDSHDKIFLTVGLVEEGETDDSARYRLTWKGDTVPEALARIAVAHDLGESHQEVEVDLPLGAAQLRIVSKKPADPRPNTEERRASKNGPRGKRGEPRLHRRICAADIERTYASRN